MGGGGGGGGGQICRDIIVLLKGAWKCLMLVYGDCALESWTCFVSCSQFESMNLRFLGVGV